MTLSKIQQRAVKALEAARNSAETYDNVVRWRLDEIYLHFGGEQGVYADQSNCYTDCAATGNWNEITTYDQFSATRKPVKGGDIVVRLGKVLEKLGVVCEWSDEWDTCSECGRLLRTDPNCYSYEPYYHETEDGRVCYNCKPKNKYPATQEWLCDEGACRDGKAFVGDRTLEEAVMDPDADDAHLEFVWDKLGLDGFERTRELLAAECARRGI